jgi:hypothetical protein
MPSIFDPRENILIMDRSEVAARRITTLQPKVKVVPKPTVV